jgi:hypothetical protein
MSADACTAPPNAHIEALRLTMLDIIDKCTDFATEVAENEAEAGCMDLITIQRHLQFPPRQGRCQRRERRRPPRVDLP